MKIQQKVTTSEFRTTDKRSVPNGIFPVEAHLRKRTSGRGFLLCEWFLSLDLCTVKNKPRGGVLRRRLCMSVVTSQRFPGADPGFFEGGVSSLGRCCTYILCYATPPPSRRTARCRASYNFGNERDGDGWGRLTGKLTGGGSRGGVNCPL